MSVRNPSLRRSRRLPIAAFGAAIVRGDGYVVDVADVQSPVSGLIVHRGTVREGEITVGAGAHAEVDTARRRSRGRTPPPASSTPGCARPSATPPRRRAR